MTRAKEQIHGDEEAGAELKLGEFQNVSSLTLSETKEVLTAVFNHRREQGKFKVPDNEYVSFSFSHFPLLLLNTGCDGASADELDPPES